VEVNFEMVLGSATESVTVRGGAPLLDTESSAMGTVVEQRKVNELPLNGRNVFNLIELAASVVPQGSSTGTPVGVNPFGWGNYQVNGSFANESAEYLDGQPLNIGYINLPVLIPTQDSIQEFKVQTSNLGPEWGKFSGGVTNLSTKAGTSSLHGEAYEYLRNRIFNANDFYPQPLSLAFSESDWRVTLSLLPIAMIYTYRMYRFGLSYANELYAQFLLLPAQPPLPKRPSNITRLPVS